MKNKGYTLIELLGVIIILSLLVSFAVPTIINVIKSSTNKKDKLVEDLIINAAEMYVDDYDNEFYSIYGNVTCISLNDLVELDYLKNKVEIDGKDVTDLKSVKISYTNKYNYEIVDNNKCDYMSIDLFNNLVPITYDGNNWLVADVNTKWYDYNKQEWANAVILNKGLEKKVGDVVTVDGENSDALAMFVWIPRYEYKIEGTYGKGGTSASEPGEIEVNFISKNQKEPTSGYIIHPAFKFGNTELSGIWVGKFETSHTTLSGSTIDNNLECINENCENANGIRILPNKVSLRYNNIANFFFASRSMSKTNNVFEIDANITDSHMMKNSEWGAVAYLTQSKYGKYGNAYYTGVNKEIYSNKSEEYLTGKSNGTPSQATINIQCSYDDIIDVGEGKGYCGAGASTTGNIYGVYDMSGGSWEHVMGVYSNSNNQLYTGRSSELNSGFKGLSTYDILLEGLEFPNSKYYDKYVEGFVTTLKGHALDEVRGWYGDYSWGVDNAGAWYARGGYYNSKKIPEIESSTDPMAGVFAFTNSVGDSQDDTSFRIVLTLK